MKIQMLLIAACVTIAAGCSTASGPMHNTDTLKSEDGSVTYRVQCQGLLESGKTCVKQAEKVCGDRSVRELSSLEPTADDSRSGSDRRREITFTCETPKAK